MTIIYEKLLALKIPDVEQTYGPKDCMLYALGVGLGLDPTDERQLAFVFRTERTTAAYAFPQPNA